MTRYWPDTLPTPIGPGFELTPIDQFLRTDMEVGPARTRRLTRARRDRVQAVWKMTNAEFVAFRAWFEDTAWSLAGDSDDLAGWTAFNVVWTPGAGVGPNDQVTGRLLETADNAVHRHSRTIAALTNGQTAVFTVSLRAAGRTLARVQMVGRDGTSRFLDVDLTAGASINASGLIASSVKVLRGGWYRATITATVGSGGSSPIARVTLMSAPVTTSYAGDPLLGIDIAEVNVRRQTGYDLYVPTDADGVATGAAGGAAWALIPMWTGGDLTRLECRFEGPFSTQVLEGLNVNVSAPIEVRYA
jgi:hypothetical protein